MSRRIPVLAVPSVEEDTGSGTEVAAGTGTETATGTGTATVTGTETETETEVRSRLAPPWNVVVHDDPVTLMSYVTRVFMKVFGYAETKARRLMLEVHETGRSVVWTGGREEAETYAHKLQGHHLLASLELAEA